MALTARTLTNTGAPLYSPNGTLLTNTKISFTLVDSIGNPTDAFDVVDQARVSGSITTITDQYGVFSVSLWPNDRGDKTTKYVCSVPGCVDFSAQVPSGSIPLSWFNFKHSGAVLTAAEVSVLNSHLADTLLHLTPAQNTFLDALEVDLSTKENIGVAASLDASHLAAFNHANIAHSNRSALDLVSGTNTGDQDLTPYATKNSPSFTGDILSTLVGNQNITIDATNPRVMTKGVIKVDHVAGMNGTRPISLNINANGFGDTSALVVNYVATGLTPQTESHINNINIDTDASTGGSIEGLAVTKTGEGLAEVTAVHAHIDVNVIKQSSGSVTAASNAFLYNNATFTDVSSSFGSLIVNTPIFVNNTDYVYIGNSTKFNSIDVSLERVASGSGIIPTFEYSIGTQPNDWALAAPVDGTNGFRQNGTITLSTQPSNWTTKDVNGVNAFWVRIRRTNAAAITSPIENRIRIDSAVTYGWDKDGKLDLSKITLRNLQTFNSVAAAITGGLTSGQVFRDNNGALYIV